MCGLSFGIYIARVVTYLYRIKSYRITNMLSQTAKWILFYPVQLIICCFGIPCNVISALVWSRLRRKGKRKNKHVCMYFILLSIVDICVLIFSILSDLLPVVNRQLVEGASPLFGRIFIYLIHPAHFLFLFISIFLVTMLSMERLKFILKPFSSLTFSKKWSRGLLFAVFCISFVVNIPSFFEYRLATVNGTTYILKALKYEANQSFRDIVFLSHCMFGLALPWLIMLVCNVILVTKSYNRLRVTTKNSVNNDTVHLLKTTSALTFSSLFLLSVQCVSRCFKMFTFDSETNWELINKIADIGHLAIPLNSSVNFIMFCLPGSYFRNEMVDMFKSISSPKESKQEKRKNMNGSTDSTDYSTATTTQTLELKACDNEVYIGEDE